MPTATDKALSPSIGVRKTDLKRVRARASHRQLCYLYCVNQPPPLPPPSIHACPYTFPLLPPSLASSCSIASSSSCFPKDSLSIFFRLPSRNISENPRPDFTDKKFLIRLEILKQSLLLQDPEHHHLNRLANQRDTERMLGDSAQHRFLKLRARGGSLQDSQTKQDNKTM